MDWLLIFFRLTHIPAAIVWAGGALFIEFYVQPAIEHGGPKAAGIIEMMSKTRVYFTLAATLTVVGGAALYIHDAGGLQLWTTTSGWVFTLGAVCGIIAWASGGALLAPRLAQISKIGAEMQAAGGPPSADLLGRMQVLQGQVKRIGRTDTILIIVAIVTMATARYVG